METVKKFVVIGPESTGKSTLSKQLADHFKTAWVPEYAREYLETNGTDYHYEDLLTIAKGQISLENTIVNRQSSRAHNTTPVFIDTDMYVMKVWCEFVFNKCHNWILNRIAEREYDGYLLCNVDLPWVKDSLREYPDLETREKLYHFYKDILINQSVPWADISGNYNERLQKAIEFTGQKV
ncbi:MAG TPA: ATP-binding protein [Chitinophagaceae bacterium]|nr:ATP-binding protein [Chitinophagaceae bacterium]